jgi:hypothetical protein
MGRGGRGAGLLAVAMIVVASASLARATTIQSGGLRITVLAQVAPYKLPRTGTAPISAFVSGHVENPHGGIPSQLQTMTIDLNRHALLRSEGLPVCQISRIQPSSTQRALSTCGDSLIGSGLFWASIVLPEQGSYPTHGRLLIFNGRLHGRPAILAHIYTRDPFDSSFVVAFTISKIAKGRYGTELTASLPESLGEWGYVNRIKLTLKREYLFEGRKLSYFNAGCPALPGARLASYPLARATLGFAEQRIAATVIKRCAVAR